MSKARTISKDKNRERRLIGSRDADLDHELNLIIGDSVKSLSARVTEIVSKHLRREKIEKA